MKLYKLSIGREGSITVYVVAKDPGDAEDNVLCYMRDNDLCFTSDRVVKTMELLADDTGSLDMVQKKPLLLL